MSGMLKVLGLIASHRWWAVIGGVILTAGLADIAQADPPGCYDKGRYRIVMQERTDEVGTDYLIQPLTDRAATACTWDESRRGSYVLGRDHEPRHFLAFSGSTLFSDIGTGPESDLEIFDVIRRRRLLSLSYDDNRAPRFELGKATFWMFDRKASAHRVCPMRVRKNDHDGLGTVVVAEVRFTERDRRIERLGRIGCRATQ